MSLGACGKADTSTDKFIRTMSYAKIDSYATDVIKALSQQAALPTGEID